MEVRKLQMKSMRQRRFMSTVLLTLVFLAASLLPVYAQSINELRDEQEDNQQVIEENEEKIQEIKKQEGATLEDINELAANISRLESELLEIDQQLTKLGREVKKAEAELIEAEAKLEERSKILGERVKIIYENGTVGYIEVLFKAESFSDFLGRLEFLKKIAQQDSELVEEIRAEREEITVKKQELESNQAKMELLQKRVEANRQELDQQKDLQEVKLKEIKSNRFEAEKDQAQAEADNKRVEELIRQKLTPVNRGNSGSNSGSNSDTPALGSGQFAWPVPGHSRVSSPYGWRNHPIFGNKRFHSGIDIPAPTGSKAAAADNGTVIHAGWLGGYGNAIIIDHGEGVSTLYGHLNSIEVGSGQAVTRGQRIAGVGSTGNSTGPHVHFEVRVNGKHTSPWPYLR